MPDKIYKKCGKSCVKCWYNRLKHGNRESKAYLKKHGVDFESSIVDVPRKEERVIGSSL